MKSTPHTSYLKKGSIVIACDNCNRGFVNCTIFCQQIKDQFETLYGDIFISVQYSPTKSEIYHNGKVGYTLLTPKEAEFYMQRLRDFYSNLYRKDDKNATRFRTA